MTQDGAPRHADRQRLALSLGVGLVVIALTAVAFLAGLGVLGPRPVATPLPAVAAAPTGAPPLPTSTAVPPTPTATRPRPTATPPPTATSSPTPEPGTSNVYIEYVLDASGSMVEALPAGRTKLALARTLLTDHLAAFRPETNVGLRAYGHRLPYLNNVAQSCQDIELIAPPAPGNLETLAAWLATFQAQGMTPLAESLRQALADFTFDPARLNSVVLLSDGIETCGGDPCRLVQALKAQGINFTIHVIGLDVDQPTREQLSCIAAAAGGAYHDAKSEQDLSQALAAVKQDVTEDEIITAHGLDTPTPPPTATFTPVPPTATSTATPVPPTPTVAPLARGEWIAFISDRDHVDEVDRMRRLLEVYIMRPDGSQQTEVLADDSLSSLTSFLSWIPNRLEVSAAGAAGGDHAYVDIIDLSTSSRRILDLVQGAWIGITPRWSPDGRQMAFASPGAGRTFSLYTANADGSAWRQITNPPDGEWGDWLPHWSPDGSQIAYSHSTRGDDGIYVVAADGSAARKIFSGAARMVAWSPDGSRLAFENNESFNQRSIWTVKADGSDAINLTGSSGSYDEHPSWSPDGRQIAFASVTDTENFGFQIFVMNADGSERRQLTSQGSNFAPAWSP